MAIGISRIIGSFISGFNAIFICAYISSGDAPGSRGKYIYYVLLGLAVITFVTTLCNTKRANFLIQTQLPITSAITLFIVLEFTVRLVPSLIPPQLANHYNPSPQPNKSGVEILEESPFGKFKPFKQISTAGYLRGDDFVYSWLTDKNGFKNSNDLANKEKVTIVALGDSFTEGLGVSTENTWPGLLTKNNIPTYNLGVQGYAPIQMEGAFRKYGLNYNPKYVIIGYCSASYSREEIFFNFNKDDAKLSGGIEEVRSGAEIRKSRRYILSAVHALLKEFIFSGYQSLPIGTRKAVKPPFGSYQYEFDIVDRLTQDTDKKISSQEWKSTLKRFLSIKEMADNIGAETILLHLPRRRLIYYEHAKGVPVPEETFELFEAEKLRKFALNNGLKYINPTARLKEYVERLPHHLDSKKLLPYLSHDGHMSPIGNQIVADMVKSELKL